MMNHTEIKAILITANAEMCNYSIQGVNQRRIIVTCGFSGSTTDDRNGLFTRITAELNRCAVDYRIPVELPWTIVI